MSRLVQYKPNVDHYEIALKDGATIELNVGSSGAVNIPGDLNVTGAVTQTEQNNIVVSDNTIRLNDGETGAGITLGDAGIEIDRGTRDDAEFLFDESLFTIRDGAQYGGAFTMKLANGDPIGLYATSILAPSGDNITIKPDNGLVVVSESSSEEYEKRVFPYTGDDISTNVGNPDGLASPNNINAVPNIQVVKDYVAGYFNYNFQDRLVLGELTPTEVRLYDAEDDILETSRISLTVEGVNNFTLYESRLEIEDVKIEGNIIRPVSLDEDLILRGGQTGGNVKVDSYLEMTIETDPDAPDAGVLLYSKTLGDGGTGLYFKNSDDTSDEFVSRNKALLYSIIF